MEDFSAHYVEFFQESLCVFLNIIFITVIPTAPYTIMIIYYIKILKYLQNHQHSLSITCKKVQRDLNRVLLAQAVIPIPFAFFPGSIHIISSVVDFDLTVESLVCGVLYSWIPVGNAVSILFFVTAYRRKLMKIIFHMKPQLFRISVSAQVNINR